MFSYRMIIIEFIQYISLIHCLPMVYYYFFFYLNAYLGITLLLLLLLFIFSCLYKILHVNFLDQHPSQVSHSPYQSPSNSQYIRHRCSVVVRLLVGRFLYSRVSFVIIFSLAVFRTRTVPSIILPVSTNV